MTIILRMTKFQRGKITAQIKRILHAFYFENNIYLTPYGFIFGFIRIRVLFNYSERYRIANM